MAHNFTVGDIRVASNESSNNGVEAHFQGVSLAYGALDSAVLVTASAPLPVNDAPLATGGMSTSSHISTAAVLSQSIKATAGTVYGIRGFTIDDAPNFIKVYDKASAASASDTPIMRVAIPKAASATDGTAINLSFPKGIACSNGIAIRATTSLVDSGTGALEADKTIVEIDYK